MHINVTFSRERRSSSVLLVDYFENSSMDFAGRFVPQDPFYELVAPAFESGDFCGRWKQTLLLYTYGRLPEQRILLVGLGPKKEVSPFKIKVAFAFALKRLQKLNIQEVTAFIDKKCCPDEFRAVSEFLAEAAYLSQYRHPCYKKDPPQAHRPIERIHLIVPPEVDQECIAQGIEEGRLIGMAVNEVRNLINQPSNYMTPTRLGEYARELAQQHASIETEIFNKEQISSMGMGGLLAVSKGSQEPPCFIKCCYTPPEMTDTHTVALVGKGVTFDAGGISLKRSQGMYRMKDDMSGGALVLGIIKLAAQLRLPLRLLGLVPSCENLPGSTALKPGDIITAFDGTTVEVYDTDCEGRLILMDALGYAVAQKAEVIVDLATLTGACTVALGRYVIGGMTNYEPVMDIMRASGDYIYERVWQLPLMEEYKLSLNSLFADLKNYGGKEGGAITAGAFLSHFVRKTPWIHLDIAGVSWFDTETSLIPEGASGIGIRLIIDFLKRLCKERGPQVWGQQGISIDGPTDKEDEVYMDPHTHRMPQFQRGYSVS